MGCLSSQHAFVDVQHKSPNDASSVQLSNSSDEAVGSPSIVNTGTPSTAKSSPSISSLSKPAKSQLDGQRTDQMVDSDDTSGHRIGEILHNFYDKRTHSRYYDINRSDERRPQPNKSTILSIIRRVHVQQDNAPSPSATGPMPRSMQVHSRSDNRTTCTATPAYSTSASRPRISRSVPRESKKHSFAKKALSRESKKNSMANSNENAPSSFCVRCKESTVTFHSKSGPNNSSQSARQTIAKSHSPAVRETDREEQFTVLQSAIDRKDDSSDSENSDSENSFFESITELTAIERKKSGGTNSVNGLTVIQHSTPALSPTDPDGSRTASMTFPMVDPTKASTNSNITSHHLYRVGRKTPKSRNVNNPFYHSDCGSEETQDTLDADGASTSYQWSMHDFNGMTGIPSSKKATGHHISNMVQQHHIHNPFGLSGHSRKSARSSTGNVAHSGIRQFTVRRTKTFQQQFPRDRDTFHRGAPLHRMKTFQPTTARRVHHYYPVTQYRSVGSFKMDSNASSKQSASTRTITVQGQHLFSRLSSMNSMKAHDSNQSTGAQQGSTGTTTASEQAAVIMEESESPPVYPMIFTSTSTGSTSEVSEDDDLNFNVNDIVSDVVNDGPNGINQRGTQIIRNRLRDRDSEDECTVDTVYSVDPSISSAPSEPWYKKRNPSVQYYRYTRYKPANKTANKTGNKSGNSSDETVSTTRHRMRRRLPFPTSTRSTRSRPPIHNFNHLSMKLEEENETGLDPEGVEEEADDEGDDDDVEGVDASVSPCSSVGSTLL